MNPRLAHRGLHGTLRVGLHSMEDVVWETLAAWSPLAVLADIKSSQGQQHRHRHLTGEFSDG